MQAREIISLYEESRDMIEVGAYVEGQRPKLDRAIKLIDRNNEFLRQGLVSNIARENALNELRRILASRRAV